MRIGIDTFSFDKPGDNHGVGPGVYVWHLLPELFKIGNEHHFIIFCNKENYCMLPNYNNVKIIINNIHHKIRASRIYHEQVFIPKHFYKEKLDCIHFLGNNICFQLKDYCVLTVYDLMWNYYFKMGYKNLKNIYFNVTVPISLKFSSRLITISDFIAKEVSKTFNIPSKKINPIHLAPSKIIDLRKNEEIQFSKKYPFDYLLTVTTSLPHKNLIVLLRAFLEIKRKDLFSGKLIVAGQQKGRFHTSHLKFLIDNRIEKDVIFTGFISDVEKAYLYRHSKFTIYPSLYEGFGLPVLESMGVGRPVITSQIASLPEVGGNACIYFNPYSEDDLIQKILLLINDEEKYNELVKKGHMRYKHFSWNKTAEKTLKVYYNYLNDR